MILLTVGTLFPFDRLVRAVDQLVGQGMIDDEVFAQIAPGAWKPKRMDSTERLTKAEFEAILIQADALISHAGMGSIGLAIEHLKPMLVVPRRRCYGEHVNDHQVGTARRFEAMGHVLAAYEIEQIQEKLKDLKNFTPEPRANQVSQVASRIQEFIDTHL